MKVKIFISTFSLPLFWFANFIVKEYYHDFFFNQFVALGLFLGSLLKLVIARKFLKDLIIVDNVISIDYYNQLMIKKSLTLSLLDIQNVEYVNKNWLLDDFDKLNLKTSKDILTFNLTTKSIKEKAKSEMHLKHFKFLNV
jgi:hypothetical protein